MSYQVIARKWRPQTFDDLVGQQHVTETLKNAIKNDRVAHAYIFSGARGVGKTTAARILAKALNCVKGPTATPCGECDSCKEIASGTSLDVIEIDAASNRGIDQIRELREMVRYAPAASRSKVVILDEARRPGRYHPVSVTALSFSRTDLRRDCGTAGRDCEKRGFEDRTGRDGGDRANGGRQLA